MAFTKITGPGIHTLTNIVSHNVKSSGIITAVNGNLNGWLAVGSTASFSGNVSIGGTLTYDDVTNVESVGLITAKAGIFIPDDQKLELGNAAGSGDLSLFYDSTPGESLITHTGPGVFKIEGNSSNNIFIRPKSGENSITAKPDKDVELYFNNELRFSTSGVGATIRDSAASGSGISNSLDLLNIGNNSGDGSSISFLRSPGSTRAQIIAIKNENTNNETDLVFKTTKSGGTLTESLRILGNTQRVGIGTTIPNAPIHIQSSDNTLGILTSTDDGANLDLSDNDTMSRIRSVDGRLHLYADFGSNVSNSSIRFFVDSSSEKVRFTNTGRVGIGTTNPTRNLQIGGLSVNSYNVIRFGRRIASQNTNLPLIGHHSGDGTGSGLALCATSTNGAIHFFTGNGGNGFGANDNQERVIIKHDGKVGIGTTLPRQELHIHEGDIIIGQDSGNSTDIRNYIKFGRVIGPKAAIGFINDTGNGRGDIIFMNSDVSNASEFTTSDEVVRITHEGEVLINEGSPRSYVDGAGNTQTPKLQVESDDNTSTAISLTYNSGAGAANRRASFMFARTADGTAVADDSVLGEVLFMGEANSTLEKAASIRANVDGNVGVNSMPGRLVFSTTAAGSDSPSERLRITSAGLVGIGLANPTFKLHVYGGNMRIAQPAGTECILDIQEGTTTNPIRIKQTATEGRIINSASQPFNIRAQSGSGSSAHLAFWTRDDERLRIAADGNVGIGTDNPTQILHILDANPIIQFTDTNGLGSRINADSGNLYLDTHNNNRDIIFRGGNSSTDEVARITGDGLVGIGTDDPDKKLHVYNGAGNVTSFVEAIAGDALLDLSNSGNGNFSGINFIRERGSGQTGINGGSIFMPSNTANNEAFLYIQTQSASAGAGVTSALSANNGVRLKLHGADGIFSVETGADERLRITNDGNVGIGTDDPTSRLHIETRTGTATRMTVSQQKTYGSGTGTDERAGLDLAIREASQVAGNRIFGRIEVGTQSESTSQNGFMSFFTRYSGAIHERMRIDAFGRILIGRTSNHQGTGSNPIVQIQSTSTNNYGRIELAYAGGNTLGPAVYFVKARGSTADSNTAAGSADQCGALFFLAADGNDRGNRVASIQAYTNGTISSNVTPGKLVFRTTPSNDNATLERLSIDSAGIVQLNTANNTYIRGGIYAKYTGASGSTANINTASASKISWLQTDTEVFENGGFTNTATDVTVPKTGIYKVIFNGYLQGTGTGTTNQRTNQRFRFRINGTDQTHDISMNNYIRAHSGHDDSSVNLTAYLNLSAGDTVAVSSQRMAQTGDVTMLKNHSSLTFHLVA